MRSGRDPSVNAVASPGTGGCAFFRVRGRRFSTFAAVLRACHRARETGYPLFLAAEAPRAFGAPTIGAIADFSFDIIINSAIV